MLTNQDRETLRSLAAQYMHEAERPIHKEKVLLWRALNRGEMQRPMVMIDQLPWNELEVDPFLQCSVRDPFWQNIERSLRRSLYKWQHFPVDSVLEPFISIPMAVYKSSFGMLPQVERLGETGSTAFSQSYTNQLHSMDALAELCDVEIVHEEKKTRERKEQAQELFDGIAPIRMRGLDSFHLGIWDYLTTLMGADEALLALLDQPELIHAALERLTEATLHGIEQANAMLVHDSCNNLCHCVHTYTDDLLPDSGAGREWQSQNCWAFGLAQIFTAISPAMFAEFEIPYIKRMAQAFGYLYYGCCDRLDDRLDLVKQIPHVRKVSCSPWSDRKHFAAEIGTQLVMSNKPTPAFLGTPEFSEEQIRADLLLTCQLAKANQVNLELVLKDVSTVRNDPQRIDRWAKIAMEVVCG